MSRIFTRNYVTGVGVCVNKKKKNGLLGNKYTHNIFELETEEMRVKQNLSDGISGWENLLEDSE